MICQLRIFQYSCLLFADDLKIFSVVRNGDDEMSLRNDLNHLNFGLTLGYHSYHKMLLNVGH